MADTFRNVYEDELRASSYADLEFPGTYYLAIRDLPSIIAEHVHGDVALDFGCGAGRSSRFLKELGFEVLGVDISEPMLTRARARDPEGEYALVPDGDLSELVGRRFDLVLSAFTFDNIPGYAKRLRLFESLGDLLAEEGRIVNVVSSAELYVNEWASFSTKDFAENRSAEPGDTVRIVMLDVPDRRPVTDIFWTEPAYRELYRSARLDLLHAHHPLGRPTDPFEWRTETRVAPWTIYVLGRPGGAGRPARRDGAGRPARRDGA